MELPENGTGHYTRHGYVVETARSNAQAAALAFDQCLADAPAALHAAVKRRPVPAGYRPR